MARTPYRTADAPLDGARSDAASAPPLPVLAEGELVVVPKGTSFPEVCVKCGKKRELHLKQHRFAFARQPTLGKRVLWGALLGPVGGAVATAQATEYASFALPICARCESRWTDAKLASIGSLLPFVATAIWLFASLANRVPGDSLAVPALVFLASIAPVAWAHRAFVPPRVIRCLGIEGRYVKLGGLGPAARSALVASTDGSVAPRKKKKSKGA